MKTIPNRTKSEPGHVAPQRRAEYGPCILRLLEYVPVTAIQDDVWMQRTVKFLTLLGKYLSGPECAALSAKQATKAKQFKRKRKES